MTYAVPWAVSNSSPLIGLSILGRLELLREFYGEVSIPPTVLREVVADGRGKSGSLDVNTAVADGWIRVAAPTDEPLVASLRRDLDPGESEAIALALTGGAGVLIIDETDGRRIAGSLGISIIGTVGVLIRAAHEGRIDNLREELDTLIQAGFYIREDLYRQALAAVGETPSQSYP